jgi:hypothetical protein
MQQGVAGCNNLMQGCINIVFVTVYTRAELQFWSPYRDLLVVRSVMGFGV